MTLLSSKQTMKLLVFLVIFSFVTIFNKAHAYDKEAGYELLKDYLMTDVNDNGEMMNKNDEYAVIDDEDSNLKHLGKGFYIPAQNLLAEDLKHGRSIFKTIPDEYIDSKPLSISERNFKYYSSMKSFFSSLATENSLSTSIAGPFTMGATLNVVTKGEISKEDKMKGVTLDIHTHTFKKVLSTDFILGGPVDKLSDEFTSHFESLPVKIDKPWIEHSWYKYQEFLDKFGSHVVSEVIYGASVFQNELTKSKKEISERLLKVKACLDLAGPTQAGKLDVKGCSDISSQEKKEAESMSTSEHVVVRGGPANLRNALLFDHPPDKINEFLNNAGMDSAVKYHFIPVWKILREAYRNNEQNYIKAVKLEQYFIGYKSYGCGYLTSGSTVLRKFILNPNSSPSYPRYECILPPKGCNTDDDCDYVASWTKCTCHGDTCINYCDVNYGGTTKQVGCINKGYDWGWQDEARCYYGFGGCYCNNDAKTNWKSVWPPVNLLKKKLFEILMGIKYI